MVLRVLGVKLEQHLRDLQLPAVLGLRVRVRVHHLGEELEAARGAGHHAEVERPVAEAEVVRAVGHAPGRDLRAALAGLAMRPALRAALPAALLDDHHARFKIARVSADSAQ